MKIKAIIALLLFLPLTLNTVVGTHDCSASFGDNDSDGLPNTSDPDDDNDLLPDADDPFPCHADGDGDGLWDIMEYTGELPVNFFNGGITHSVTKLQHTEFTAFPGEEETYAATTLPNLHMILGSGHEFYKFRVGESGPISSTRPQTDAFFTNKCGIDYAHLYGFRYACVGAAGEEIWASTATTLGRDGVELGNYAYASLIVMENTPGDVVTMAIYSGGDGVKKASGESITGTAAGRVFGGIRGDRFESMWRSASNSDQVHFRSWGGQILQNECSIDQVISSAPEGLIYSDGTNYRLMTPESCTVQNYGPVMADFSFVHRGDHWAQGWIVNEIDSTTEGFQFSFTLPGTEDTDGDGWLDGAESLVGSNPARANHYLNLDFESVLPGQAVIETIGVAIKTGPRVLAANWEATVTSPSLQTEFFQLAPLVDGVNRATIPGFEEGLLTFEIPGANMLDNGYWPLSGPINLS